MRPAGASTNDRRRGLGGGLHPPSLPVPDPSRLHGLVLGAAIGDALAMPVDGLSHQNVRLYYRGVKGFVASEHGGTAAGTGTARTARLLARLGGTLPDADDWLPPAAAALVDATADAALGTAPAGVDGDAALRSVHAHALARLTAVDASAFDADAFCAATAADLHAFDPALGEALDTVLARRRAVPLDLFDAADRAAYAFDDAPGVAAWLFAVAMFARAPTLVEASLLSAINAGGASATTGLALGGLLGALHGDAAFPAEWHDGLVAQGALVAAMGRG